MSKGDSVHVYCVMAEHMSVDVSITESNDSDGAGSDDADTTETTNTSTDKNDVSVGVSGFRPVIQQGSISTELVATDTTQTSSPQMKSNPKRKSAARNPLDGKETWILAAQWAAPDPYDVPNYEPVAWRDVFNMPVVHRRKDPATFAKALLKEDM